MRALGLIAAALASNMAHGSILYVNMGASAGGDGHTWSASLIRLQDALAIAQAGDEVWVAQGVYHPGAPGDTAASFVVPPGVSVYGGFAGHETLRSQRNWTQNRTELSGDLADDDTFGNPWYVNWATNTPNSLHVLQTTGGTVVLDGLTLSHGNAIQTSGGAVQATSTQLELHNCRITRNAGYQGVGAGVQIQDGSLTMTGCDVLENFGRFVSGTGVHVSGTCAATITACRFLDNRAQADTSLGSGAAIEFCSSATNRVTTSLFDSNVGLPFGGGSYFSFGGAIHNFTSPLVVTQCEFRRNQCNNGGAIYSWRDLTVANCLFTGNQVYSNPSGGGVGGAVASYFYNPYTLRMTGCTIVNNTGHETGGVSVKGSGNFTSDISNSIFWGNSDVNGNVSEAHVRKASNSCIQNLWVARPGEDPIDPAKFPQCFDSNPQFVSTTDFRLLLTSPCIDAGSKGKFDRLWKADLSGVVRFFDVLSAPNTGQGVGPLPDMGCYEAGSTRYTGRGPGLGRG